MNKNNFHIRNYKEKDFKKILKIFIEFQMINKIGTYYNISKKSSHKFYIMFLANEIKKLINESDIVHCCFNEENDLVGFCCYKFAGDNDIRLELAIKNIKFSFCKKIKDAMLASLNKVKKEKECIYCCLGYREKFDKYKKFIAKKFDIEEIGKDEFNKVLIKFNV